jgi:hypothetical protein
VTRLRHVERGIYSAGLEGEHLAQWLRSSLFRWQFTYSQSDRNEPDLRETIRGPLADGTSVFTALPQSGQRFYNGLTDKIYEPLAEWSIPFFTGRVSGMFKAGFRSTFRDRDFAARRSARRLRDP